MVSGVYKVYLDGKLVAEKSNSITKAGRSIILKSIMGLIPTVGGEIAVGISNTPNGSKDSEGFITKTNLDFAIGSAPVTLSYLDNSSSYDAIVFKGTLGSVIDPTESYTIYELGIFPGQNNTVFDVSNFAPLYSFNNSEIWKEAGVQIPGTYDGTTSSFISKSEASSASYPGSFRIGSKALFIKSGETVSSNITFVDKLKKFSGQDTLAIAYSKKSADNPTVTIKLCNDQYNYYTATYSLSSSDTYGIKTVTIDSLIQAVTGTVTSVDNLNYIEISSSGANVIIDGIRLNDAEVLDPTFGMVSRTVLDTPITKDSASSLEIEYYLSVGFNKAV